MMLRLPQRAAVALEKFVSLLILRARRRLDVLFLDFTEERLQDPPRVDLQRAEDSFQKLQLRTNNAQSL